MNATLTQPEKSPAEPDRPADDTASKAPARSGSKSRGGPSKTIINFWLDALLMLNFVVLCWVSVVVKFVFPPAVESAGWALWGLTYDGWATVQFATLCVMAVGVLVHVMLHWSWVCGVIAGKMMRRADGKKPYLDDGVQTLYGVALLIIIFHVIAFAIAAAALMITQGGA